VPTYPLFLDELDAHGCANAQALALRMTGRADQPELFEDNPTPQAVAVRIDLVRVERRRSCGEVWLGWTLWRALKLDESCARLLSTGRETVPLARMAAVLCMARLCEPSSGLHIAEDWYRRTALDTLLGVPVDRVDDNRLYRALDALVPHTGEREQHLRARLGELFSLHYDRLLYDVTSTFYEGEALHNPLAQPGYSRDQRPDCTPVCIALVVTRDGVEFVDDHTAPAGLRLPWNARPKWDEWARHIQGCTEVEAAFRIHPSDRRIRPIQGTGVATIPAALSGWRRFCCTETSLIPLQCEHAARLKESRGSPCWRHLSCGRRCSPLVTLAPAAESA
jgi:hypothetical protein